MVTQPHQRSRLDGAWSRLDHTFGKHGLKFMQHLPKYIYAPLEPRNIRILELQPGRSGPFRAHFSVVSVDSGIEYDALSYMWGEATPLIICHFYICMYFETCQNLKSAGNSVVECRIAAHP